MYISLAFTCMKYIVIGSKTNGNIFIIGTISYIDIYQAYTNIYVYVCVINFCTYKPNTFILKLINTCWFYINKYKHRYVLQKHTQQHRFLYIYCMLF